MIYQILLALRDFVMAMLVAAVVIGIFALYYNKYPSVSTDGAAWGNIGDALSMGVIAALTLIVAIVWWIVRIVRRALQES